MSDLARKYGNGIVIKRIILFYVLSIVCVFYLVVMLQHLAHILVVFHFDRYVTACSTQNGLVPKLQNIRLKYGK